MEIITNKALWHLGTLELFIEVNLVDKHVETHSALVDYHHSCKVVSPDKGRTGSPLVRSTNGVEMVYSGKIEDAEFEEIDDRKRKSS